MEQESVIEPRPDMELWLVEDERICVCSNVIMDFHSQTVTIVYINVMKQSLSGSIEHIQTHYEVKFFSVIIASSCRIKLAMDLEIELCKIHCYH